jgi:flagellar basal-body rod protein FlgF
MDRVVYIAMTGAQQLLEQQSVTAHNLANAGTTGYKAETAAFRVAPVVGPGLPTRAYAIDSTTGADLAPGAIQPTGRELDVAIEGDGFFTVQGRDGSEAYTRAGSFDVSPDGELVTRSGLQVLGEGGPINVPADSRIAIGRDGTVSATTAGQSAATVSVLGKLKLVNAPQGALMKGGDGLFRARDGAPLDADAAVAVTSGALEGSNVNAVSAMVDMITLSRNFEMQMKLLQTAEQNEQHATQLLSAGSGG